MNFLFKKNIFLIAVIFAVSAVFYYLDWSRFLNGEAAVISPWETSRILKRVVSFLVLLLVSTAGSNALSRKDSIKMKVIFILIFAGDILLLFNIDKPGIILFFITQILLTVRNGVGLVKYVCAIKSIVQARFPVMTIVFVALIDYLILKLLYLPVMTNQDMILFVVLYMIVLSVSVVVAWMSLVVSHFKKSNALMIAAGMSAFFLCDMTVGLRMITEQVSIITVATTFTWVFYMPALLLLALSAYNTKKLSA